jgi:hypothetical protein
LQGIYQISVLCIATTGAAERSGTDYKDHFKHDLASFIEISTQLFIQQAIKATTATARLVTDQKIHNFLKY